jgi:hypothetical protein
MTPSKTVKPRCWVHGVLVIARAMTHRRANGNSMRPMVYSEDKAKRGTVACPSSATKVEPLPISAA